MRRDGGKTRTLAEVLDLVAVLLTSCSSSASPALAPRQLRSALVRRADARGVRERLSARTRTRTDVRSGRMARADETRRVVQTTVGDEIAAILLEAEVPVLLALPDTGRRVERRHRGGSARGGRETFGSFRRPPSNGNGRVCRRKRSAASRGKGTRRRTVKEMDHLSDLGSDMAFAFRDDEALCEEGSARKEGKERKKATNLETIPRQTERTQAHSIPPPDVRVILYQRADEERVRPRKPPLEAAFVLVDPLDRLPRFSFNEGPPLSADRDGGEALGELEGEAHEWAGDEETDGNVEEVKESYDKSEGQLRKARRGRRAGDAPCSGVELSGPWKRSSSGRPVCQAARSETSCVASFSDSSMIPAMGCGGGERKHRRIGRSVTYSASKRP